MVPPQGNFPGLFQNQLRGGCSAGRASEPGERALESARRVSGLAEGPDANREVSGAS